MNIQIFGRNKCFDTQKAQRFFKERRIKVQNIDLPRYGMSAGEFKSVKQAVDGLEKLINYDAPGGITVKYLAYDEDKERALLEDPGLFKTPIVRFGKLATIGYAPEIWQEWIKEGTP